MISDKKKAQNQSSTRLSETVRKGNQEKCVPDSHKPKETGKEMIKNNQKSPKVSTVKGSKFP